MGLEDNNTYINYLSLKERIIEMINDDDSSMCNLRVLTYLLESDRSTLDNLIKRREQ